MTALSRAYEVAAPDVVVDAVDGETILVNLDTGVYFRLSGASALAWTACVSGAVLASTPAADHPGFAEFVTTVIEHGLVRPAEPAASARMPDLPAGEPLDLEVYTDLQELLALDPVHDVDSAAGWPTAPR